MEKQEPKFELVKQLECKKCGCKLFKERVVLTKVKNSADANDVRVAANKVIVCEKCDTLFIPEDALNEETENSGVVKKLFN